MVNLESPDKNITIRSIRKEDLDVIWALAYGKEEREWMEWNGPYFHDPVYSFNEYLEGPGKNSVNRESQGVILYEGDIVGEISWYWEDGSLRKWLEFGLVLYPTNQWNKGIGTTACRLWIDYLFETMPDLQRVGFTTWSGNKRMMALGEKLGMTCEAVIRKVRYYRDTYYDSVKYGLLRSEWDETKNE